jgi:CBS domain-containing membrane protein
MLLMAMALNHWLLGNSYPSLVQTTTDKDSVQPLGISNNDLKQALKNMDTFMDVSLEDLSQQNQKHTLHPST